MSIFTNAQNRIVAVGASDNPGLQQHELADDHPLVGLEVEYDVEALHTERQRIRDEINELEEQLNDRE